jgi:hypothetical protein
MKKPPKLKYRLMLVPQTDTGLALPSCVAELAAKRARRVGVPLAEYIGDLAQRDLVRPAPLKKFRKAHRLWIDEFEYQHKVGEPFRFEVEVDSDSELAKRLSDNLNGRTLPEYIMSRLDDIFSSPPPSAIVLAVALAITVTLLLPTLYDNLA